MSADSNEIVNAPKRRIKIRRLRERVEKIYNAPKPTSIIEIDEPVFIESEEEQAGTMLSRIRIMRKSVFMALLGLVAVTVVGFLISSITLFCIGYFSLCAMTLYAMLDLPAPGDPTPAENQAYLTARATGNNDAAIVERGNKKRAEREEKKTAFYQAPTTLSVIKELAILPDPLEVLITEYAAPVKVYKDPSGKTRIKLFDPPPRQVAEGEVRPDQAPTP